MRGEEEGAGEPRRHGAVGSRRAGRGGVWLHGVRSGPRRRTVVRERARHLLPSGSSLRPGTLGAPRAGRLSTSTVRRSSEPRSSKLSRKAENASTYCSYEPSFGSRRQHARHTQRVPSTAQPGMTHANSGLLRDGTRA